MLRPLLPQAAMSSVNGAEVVQKCLARGVEVGGLRTDLESLDLCILPFTPAEADDCGQALGFSGYT